MITINIIFTILIAIIVFGLLIFIHELGHFVTARLFGVTVTEFSIGMGPKIVSRRGKKYATDYSLRALPIGGYVKMVGEDEASDEEGSFSGKPVWQRMIIAAAGAAMNLLLGLILTFIFVLMSERLGSNVLSGFEEGGSCLELAGAQIGDAIVEIDGASVHTSTEIVYEIMATDGTPIDVVVERGGERITLTDVVFPTATDEATGVVFGEPDFYVEPQERTVGSVISQTLYQTGASVKMIWTTLLDLVGGRYGIEAVSGPVGITEAIGTAANSGVRPLVYLCAIMAVNLGVVNLLPLPSLDGGRLVFMLIELIRGKPVKPEIEGYIHFAGIMLLFLLMIVISFKDVFALFK